MNYEYLLRMDGRTVSKLEEPSRKQKRRKQHQDVNIEWPAPTQSCAVTRRLLTAANLYMSYREQNYLYIIA